MVRAILGLLKGGIVGAGIGYGANYLGFGDGATGYLVSALVGFVTGVVCGRALWKHETLWTPVVKGIVGAAVCSLILFAGRKFLGGLTIPLPSALNIPARPWGQVPLVFGTLLGVAYGMLVELDDGGSSGASKAEPQVRKAKTEGS